MLLVGRRLGWSGKAGQAGGKTAFVLAGQGLAVAGYVLLYAYPVFAEAPDAAGGRVGPAPVSAADVDQSAHRDLLNTTTRPAGALFGAGGCIGCSCRGAAGFGAGSFGGRVTAAHVAGALCLPDAAMLAAARGFR